MIVTIQLKPTQLAAKERIERREIKFDGLVKSRKSPNSRHSGLSGILIFQSCYVAIRFPTSGNDDFLRVH